MFVWATCIALSVCLHLKLGLTHLAPDFGVVLDLDWDLGLNLSLDLLRALDLLRDLPLLEVGIVISNS